MSSTFHQLLQISFNFAIYNKTSVVAVVLVVTVVSVVLVVSVVNAVYNSETHNALLHVWSLKRKDV